MNIARCCSLIAMCFLITSQASSAESIWGADYFPNYELTTHEGERVKFFDDLLKDKIVVVNFIYTSCPDVCPLETAQLTRVQRILGDRLGQDIFFYSITIDPERDSVEVLREYRERFGAKWLFLRGDEDEVIDIRRKLGLYIEDIPGGENNHNVSMIIGNQSTGRWMKRSPFENPYVLADQIGNWLTGWKTPQVVKDYANAPELRNLSDGESLYRTRCLSCHSIDGGSEKLIGPDLLGVTDRRERQWLVDWLRAPDEMLLKKDPIALALFEEFNRVVMPNMDLTQVDIMDLLKFMNTRTDRARGVVRRGEGSQRGSFRNGDVVAVVNAWVRGALPGAKVHAGYMTLVNPGEANVNLTSVESPAFASVEIHTMSGAMGMEELESVVIPARGKVQLKPGDMHLMLMEPLRTIEIGEELELTLGFESGREQTLIIEIEDR